MAILKNIYECPRCSEGITSATKPKECPNCKYEFARLDHMGYTPPLTLSEQFEKYRHQPTYIRYIQTLPIEKCNYILNDALTLVSCLPGKMTDVSDIRLVVELAKSIGKMAETYEEFLKAGGKHTYSLLNPQNQKETQNGNTAPTRNGGETS